MNPGGSEELLARMSNQISPPESARLDRRWPMRIAVMGLFAVVTALGAADDSPQAQYEALVREFDTASESAIEAYTKATNDQERMKASLGRPQPHEFAPRFLPLAEKHPEDPVALDALTWIATK